MLRAARSVSEYGAGQEKSAISHLFQALTPHRQLEEAISHMHGKTCGTLRLGFAVRRSCEVLPQILSEFLRLYPDVRVEVTDADGKTAWGGYIGR